MITKTRATVEDLYRVPENGKAELVNGELVLMAATGAMPGSAGGEIFASLRSFTRMIKRGRAVPDNVGFLVNLPNRESFSPDAAYYIGPDPGMRFYQGAPVFAAEVRSEATTARKAEREMAQKRADYFAAGTLVVWDVDLLSADVIRVYRAADPLAPNVYRRGETAEAEPAVLGWTMPVDDLFPLGRIRKPVIEHIINWVTGFIAAHGYPGVLLLMALESACIPIPSEAIMPFAGAQVTAPAGGFHPNLHVLAFVGALGNLLGSILAYWVGHTGGRTFLDKYGKWVLIRKRDLDKSDDFFHRHGEITVLVSRVLPIVRTFISLPAGIARMNFPKFCVYTFVGALPFCYLLAWAGTKLGQHWQTVSTWLHKADLGISVVLLVLFALWLWHHLRPDPTEGDSVQAAGTNPS